MKEILEIFVEAHHRSLAILGTIEPSVTFDRDANRERQSRWIANPVNRERKRLAMIEYRKRQRNSVSSHA